MAANKTETGKARDVLSNLSNLFNDVRRDILSQAGRIGTDLRILHAGTESALAGGIVDDREYSVSTLKSLVMSLRANE